MSDVPAGGSGSSNPFSGLGSTITAKEMGAVMRRSDIVMAMGVLTILVVMIVPLPAFCSISSWPSRSSSRC